MRNGKPLLLFLCSFFMVTGVYAKLYTVTQDIHVRRGAGTKFDTYYKLDKGDTVEELELDGKWIKVMYKEKEGYLPAKVMQEIVEDASIPEEKSLDDVDPYEDLDPKTLAGLIGVICLMWAGRVALDKRRKKTEAAKVPETHELKSKPSYWFVCKHCNQKQRSLSTPSRAYCLKSETHEWINLGEVGDTNYHCKHCNTTILTAKLPRERDCAAGEMHTWTNLGAIGTKHYYCRDCGTTILATQMPTNVNCANAEMHTWAEL